MAGTATLDIQAAPGATRDRARQQGARDRRRSPTRPAARCRFALGARDAIHGRPLTVADRRRRGGSRSATGPAPTPAALQWLTPGADRRRAPSLSVQPGRSDPQPDLDPDPGQPRHPPDLGGADHRADAAEGGDVGRAADAATASRPGAGRRAFRFRMTHPVPPYLIAIAAGDIAFRPLGPRTGVWTEPAMLDRAAHEFVDTERMVEAAERLYGPYRWGRYDVIVLPPSFPYGGMENPTLTFLTPTFIAGDRSLVGAGRARAGAQLVGQSRHQRDLVRLLAERGLHLLFREPDHGGGLRPARAPRRRHRSPGTTCRPALARARADFAAHRAPRPRLDDPDGGSSGIVYDKGAIFLRTLERIVGRARFDAWLRSYFDRHAFQPMTSARFLADLRANLIRGDAALERRLRARPLGLSSRACPTMPRGPIRPPSPRSTRAVAAFNAGGPAAPVPFAAGTGRSGCASSRRCRASSSAARLAELDRAFGLSASGNSEVLFAWLQLALANRYDPAVPAAERFLTAHGAAQVRSAALPDLDAAGRLGPADRGRGSMPAPAPGYHRRHQRCRAACGYAELRLERPAR